MPDVPPRPEGFPWMMPYLAVGDVEKATEFYVKAFGFEPVNVLRGPNGEIAHAAFLYQDARILVGVEDRTRSEVEKPVGRTPSRLGGAGLVLYLYTEDVDALYRRAIEAGAADGFPPEDVFWGDRICLLFDPDGHAWNFATYKFEYPQGG